MSKSNELTALKVKNLKDAGTYSDGNGLYIKVTPNGSKSWILRYTMDGKPAMMGLGAYPEVSLAEARDRAAENKKKARAGINPVEEKKIKAASIKAEQSKDVMTFDKCAAKYIEAFAPEWRNAKHADQWRNTLATYASPIIGSIDIAKIETSHVFQIIQPIWKTKTETANRVRARIETIINWATTCEHRTGLNPAVWKGHFINLLPKRHKVAPVVHHPALHYNRMAEFMELLPQQMGVAARAVEFAILTAARSSEVRLATWAEIDVDAGTWIVPANRMKAKRPHTVLLSDKALALLATMKKITSGELIFPGVRDKKPLSDMTLTAVLRRMHEVSIKDGGAGWTDLTCNRVITVHGTARSTFRDWAGDITDYPGDMAELALAHAVSDMLVRFAERLSVCMVTGLCARSASLKRSALRNVRARHVPNEPNLHVALIPKLATCV